MEKAEQATATLADSDLSAAANSTQEGEHWIQISTNLKYILISITTASAATVIRQPQQWDLRYTNNYASGSQHRWEQEALVIEPSF